MEEWEILKKVMELRSEFRQSGGRSTKFVGALTTEQMREKLIQKGFNVSRRDVFIEGVPYEMDLLVLREGEPSDCLLYKPEQVNAVLEVKFRGTYGKDAIKGIKRKFDAVKKVRADIKCLYVTLSENMKYKYRVTSKKLGYPVFELFTRDTPLERALKKKGIKTTGDWNKLIKLISGK